MNDGREKMDKDFQAYLQGQSDVSRLYAESAHDELPKHLDAAILAEAHRAVGSRPGNKPGRRWYIPLSMVATLFVTVMIGLQLPYMLKDAEILQMPVTENVAISDADKDAPQRTASALLAGKNVSESKPEAQPAPALRATQSSRAAVITSDKVQERAPQEMSDSFSTGSALTPAARAMPEAEGTLPPAMTPAAGRLAEPENIMHNGVLAKEKKSLGRSEAEISNSLKAESTIQAVQKPESPKLGIAAEANAGRTETDKQNPEVWLKRIEHLQQAGKSREAKKELEEFKKYHPDFQLPEALRKL